MDYEASFWIERGFGVMRGRETGVAEVIALPNSKSTSDISGRHGMNHTEL
jgi:hypothetical protein